MSRTSGSVAILGYGTVGSGTVEVFEKNIDGVRSKSGAESASIKYILEREGVAEKLRVQETTPQRQAARFISDFNTILSDDSVSVVAELIGGLKPSYEFVKAALEKGKNVVTSNKELVAMRGAELFDIAQRHGARLLFEASVGGGIPIIRPMLTSLGTDSITEISGILNGTTNYILTRMSAGDSYEAALAEAQRLGYAEANPAADVEGHDTCRKISILTSMITGRWANPAHIHTEGITKLTQDDIKSAESRGLAYKLLGVCKKQAAGRWAVYVKPVAVLGQLAGVSDAYNAILVHGESTGDVMFYGKGAGKLPTASAVVADITSALTVGGKSDGGRIWTEEQLDIIPYTEVPNV